jgi:hypothetical protein
LPPRAASVRTGYWSGVFTGEKYLAFNAPIKPPVFVAMVAAVVSERGDLPQ